MNRSFVSTRLPKGLILIGFFTICMTHLMTDTAKAQGQSPVELRVAAASDLTRAFGELARIYERRTGQKITLIFGSSGQLTQQIANGAPFDVFASASETYIDTLEKQNLLVSHSRQRYARGKLILWGSSVSNPLPSELKDLENPRYTHIAIANPDHAPYGMAARQSLQAAGIWNKIQSKLVIGENIQQTYQFASTGNVDVALISQALLDPDRPNASGQMKPIPAKLYTPLNQAIAIIRSSTHQEQGQQFLRFVTGPDGQRLLQRYGFAKP